MRVCFTDCTLHRILNSNRRQKQCHNKPLFSDAFLFQFFFICIVVVIIFLCTHYAQVSCAFLATSSSSFWNRLFNFIFNLNVSDYTFIVDSTRMPHNWKCSFRNTANRTYDNRNISYGDHHFTVRIVFAPWNENEEKKKWKAKKEEEKNTCGCHCHLCSIFHFFFFLLIYFRRIRAFDLVFLCALPQ